METYGKKKKKTFMGSFAALRDSQYAKSKKSRANKRESSTQLPSTFHSTANIEKQETVEESPNERDNGSSDEITVDPPGDAAPTIDSNLPQLPSLNFSDKEMWIAGKSTLTEAVKSNDDHAENLSSHVRKNSAPPIPRRSSKRKSGVSRTRHRSPIKNSQHRRFPKEPIARISSGFDDQSTVSPIQSVVNPSDPNVINDSVAQTLRAMEVLKPGSTNNLVVEKKRRLKGGAFLKVKNVLQGSFRRRKNDNSQEDSLFNPPLVKSPQVPEENPRHSESPSEHDLISNEGHNRSDNNKLGPLVGNHKIPRKPVNNDDKSECSRLSHLSDPFTEPPGSRDQIVPPSTLGRQMLDYGSAPELSSPDRGNNMVPSLRNNRGFDDLDSLLTSSPLAQSTPRLRLECNHTDSDRSRRLNKVDAGSPSVLDHNTFAEDSEVYQGMLASSPVKVIKTQNQPEVVLHSIVQTVGNLAAAVQQTFSGSTSESGFAPLNRKWKKNPSPSKAQLEALRRRLPIFPDPEPAPYRTHKAKDSNDINKTNFALREKRKQDGKEENKELLEGLLTTDDESSGETEEIQQNLSTNLRRASKSLPLIVGLPSRPLSASQSSPTLGVEGLEVGASVRPRNIMDQDESMMDTDELQLVEPTRATQAFDSDEDLITF